MKLWKAMVTALALCMGMSGVSLAQDLGRPQRDRDDQRDKWQSQQQDRNRDRDDQRNKPGWQDQRSGDRDRDGGRDRDDNVYRGNSQYRQYPQYPYGNGQYGQHRQYPYGNYGGNVQQIAYNNGYQEGVGYGQSDRNNGHSYRPTNSSTYQNGTHGYNSSMGSQTAYRNAFRQGFQAGYQAGYGQGQYGYGNNRPRPW